MEKTDDEKIAELRAQIAAFGNQPTRAQGPIPPPRALMDPTTGPASRAAALEAYAGACLEVPTGQWDKTMNDAVRASIQSVLARGW